MKNRSGEKIKLASIDELLGVVNEESAMEIEISKIHPFKNHPFKVLDDEKMQDLVESVKINGVLTPVLLRMDENEEYEMVSGHRRMHAAQLAGLTTIPAIVNPNNTNLSDTEMNDNKSNHIISVDEKRFDSDNHSEDYQAYENLVKETIDYESLEVTHHDDMRQVDEIVNLIVETVMCKNDKILIASNWYPASLVKKKFLMLTYSHIEYVLHCMSGNTTKVKNIKKYLLAALFNAPSTMNGYYQAEVNHDMPGLVR